MLGALSMSRDEDMEVEDPNVSLHMPFTTLSDVLTGHARHRARDPALIFGDETLDYQSFDARVNRVAQALIESGSRKGDRIAFLGGPNLWAYEVIFGIMRMGGVVTPLSTLLRPDVLAGLILDSGATTLTVGEGYQQQGETAAELVAGERTVSVVIESGVSAFGLPFAEFSDYASTEPPLTRLNRSDRCNLIYSSGTTGVPKGIIHTHEARMWFAAAAAIALRYYYPCRALLATPPYSNGTWLAQLPTLLVGGTSVLMPHFDAGLFLELVARHRPTNTVLVPTQFQAVFDHPDCVTADFDCFRSLTSIGAPMPEPLKERVLTRVGPRLFELWGLTEGVASVICPEEMSGRLGSVGTPVVTGDLRLIDEDGLEIEGTGTGEIVGRSLKLMEGYLNRPDANEEILWSNTAGDSFIRTGDVAERDEGGYLYIRGRQKDMIISGGINVYPVDIESVLLRHPEIRDASVIGVEHEKWGETPVAFVVLEKGAALLAANLVTWLNDRLSKYQRVSDVIIRSEDFPRNALGKVLKNELIDEHACKRG